MQLVRIGGGIWDGAYVAKTRSVKPAEAVENFLKWRSPQTSKVFKTFEV